MPEVDGSFAIDAGCGCGADAGSRRPRLTGGRHALRLALIGRAGNA
jgi:hypothetical protein